MVEAENDVGARAIAKYIKGSAGSIEELHILDNKIGPRGSEEILCATGESCKSPPHSFASLSDWMQRVQWKHRISEYRHLHRQHLKLRCANFSKEDSEPLNLTLCIAISHFHTGGMS